MRAQDILLSKGCKYIIDKSTQVHGYTSTRGINHHSHRVIIRKVHMCTTARVHIIALEMSIGIGMMLIIE